MIVILSLALCLDQLIPTERRVEQCTKRYEEKDGEEISWEAEGIMCLIGPIVLR